MKLCLICNFQTAGEQDICPRDGSSMVTVGDDPLLGMVVEGRYKIQSVIGQGSAGTVYRAVQELIGREVAVKVLHDYLVSDDEFIKRFKQEAKASSRLNHPNIITIYDFGVIPQGGGRPYIAMDLLNGIPLSDVISEVNHIDLPEALPVFVQVSQALAEAHRQGVVHRDIKPENIVLVERGGQKNFPIVVDFGIARLVQEESDQAKITRTGTVCGSPTYMSPEQCTSSKVDHRSDIYSLGIVIYETLTGEVPFQHEELVRVMAMQLSDIARPIDEIRPDLSFPDALVQLVNKTLSKNPNDRYQTMDELTVALEGISLEPEPKQTASPSREMHRDLAAPGPLAQDETLQHRKNTRELGMTGQTHVGAGFGSYNAGQSMHVDPGPQIGTSTGTSNSELRTASSNYADQVQAYRDAQRAAETSGHGQLSPSNFNAGRTKTNSAEAMRGSLNILISVVSLLLLGAVIMFAMNSAKFSSMMPWSKPTQATTTVKQPDDPEALYKAGKYAAVIAALKPLKSQGKLPSDMHDKYYQSCINVAKQYMKDKKYTDATALLKEIPSKSTQGSPAKDLLRKIRRISR